MPKRCLYILVSAVLFLSCKKNSSSPVDPPSRYFIKATIDGVDYEFNDFTAATTTEPTNLFVYANNTDSVGYPDAITITFQHYQDSRIITSGVYTDTSNAYTCGLTLLQSGIFYQNVPENDAANPVVCTINSIDSVSVSGTFTGIVYYFQTSIYKTITNGSFTVPF